MNRIQIFFILSLSLLISVQSVNHEGQHDINLQNHQRDQSQQRFLESQEEYNNEEMVAVGSPQFFLYLGFAFLLCCFAGLMSGLTVGYLSIDQLQLELKMKNGSDEDKRNAAVIMPILNQHHLLLSTLLVSNAAAMETLPICLHKIMPAYLAVIFSTAGVVVFGEILPQAACTGPSQLKIARAMGPFTRCLMKILYPLCKPIALGLDYWLGHQRKTRFVKGDLKALIELHKIEKNAPKSEAHEGGDGGDGGIDRFAQLTAEETKVINSTIDLRDTPVTKEMVKIDDVFMLSNQTKISKESVDRISRSGFSKVPIFSKYDKNKIVGILKVKTLIDYNNKILNMTIGEAYKGEKKGDPKLTPVLIVSKDTSMLEMLMLFQRMRTAIALISDDTVKDKNPHATFITKQVGQSGTDIRLIGLISLKDIFEEILESKMNDDDVHGAVTMISGSGPDKIRKRRIKGGRENEESIEMMEKPEKGLKEPLLTKK